MYIGPQQKFREDVFEDFIPQLQETLPMNKAIFLSKLKQSGLLSDDFMAKLKSIPSVKDKAECLLYDVILPTLPDDTTSLDKLLGVMEAYYNDDVKKLASELCTRCYTK